MEEQKKNKIIAKKTVNIRELFNAFLAFVILALVVEVIILVTTKMVGWNPTVSGRPWVVSAHVHILVLGAMFSLVMILLDKSINITKAKNFYAFFVVYLVGFSLLLAFILYKGFTQLLGGVAISGLLQAGAAVAHVTMFVALFMFCAVLKNALGIVKNNNKSNNKNDEKVESESNASEKN
ncbi:MAG: DUF2871 family protein [Clostridia bacterium]